MKSLKKFISVKESFNDELEEISGWLSTLNDLQDALDRISGSNVLGGNRDQDENIDDHTKRYVGMILKKLINDPDIIDWYDSPYNNQLALRQILSKKLSSREITYLDEICNVLSGVTDNDNDAEIVNNAIMRLINDPDIEKWYKRKPDNPQDEYDLKSSKLMSVKGTEFELRKILSNKLSGGEKRFFEPICRKFMRIKEGEWKDDDYYQSTESNYKSNYRR